MPWRKLSLQPRLILFVSALITGAVVLLTLILTTQNKNSLLEESRRNGVQIARQIASAAEFVEEIPQRFEDALADQMLVQARLLARLVADAEAAGTSTAELTAHLQDIVRQSALDEIWITDETSYAYLRTETSVEFTFSPDPRVQPQASMFYDLLTGKKDSVVQAAMVREIDNRVFKYVGVGGVDKPRIVQVGYHVEMLNELQNTVGLPRLLQSLVRQGDIFAVYVIDPDNSIREQAQAAGHRASTQNLSGTDIAEIAAVRRDLAPRVILLEDQLKVYAPILSPQNELIGTTMLQMSPQSLQNAVFRNIRAASISAFAILVFAALLSWAGARSLVQPLRRITALAHLLASGDIQAARKQMKPTAAEAIDSADESIQLEYAMQKMIEQLSGLIGKVRKSSIQLVSTANQINATATGQQDQVGNLGTSANEIAASVRQIHATSQELVKDMEVVQEAAASTASMAESGKSGIHEMEHTIHQLSSASSSMSNRLAVIREKAKAIDGVTGTISKVADQTNLLSLNASIEAEKAGEYGYGFAVVAREIRRLSDQTAVATLDIEQMIREMQSSVSGGVVEMENFSHQVQGCVDNVETLSQRFTSILDKVQQLFPRFESVLHGMQAQNEGAEHIQQAMSLLQSANRETTQSLKEFKEAAHQLKDAVSVLRQEISQFNLS